MCWLPRVGSADIWDEGLDECLPSAQCTNIREAGLSVEHEAFRWEDTDVSDDGGMVDGLQYGDKAFVANKGVCLLVFQRSFVSRPAS